MPTTVSQVMEVMTLSALTRTIAFASDAAEEEAAATKSAPSQAVSGKCSALAWASRPGVTLKSAHDEDDPLNEERLPAGRTQEAGGQAAR